jgi:hypothetical protein
MNPEKEKAWNEGFQAGLKEIKSMLEEEIEKSSNSETKFWISEFLSKVSKLINK